MTSIHKGNYSGEQELAAGSIAFKVLCNRFKTGQSLSGHGSKKGQNTAEIRITRSALAVSKIGSDPQQIASAWPTPRSNRWVFDLFSRERAKLGDLILVPAQVSFGSISGMTADGDDKPEAAADLNPSLVPVRKAAVWTKMTDETVEDYDGFAEWMNSELTRQLLSEIDNQLLNGNGVNPLMQGLLGNANIQTQSKGADSLTVAISKAIAKVLKAGFYPTAIVVSPDDFAALTAATPVEFRGTFFDVPLIASEHAANNLPVVGDFTTATVFERSPLIFSLTNTDQDDFIQNLLTLRAEQRLALAVFAPKAFCKVVT
ncbi:MAG: phage major capsid protein [Acidobacteria bacterium]|nr:phage major capsid protein [Acidobacteriota bacterium]